MVSLGRTVPLLLVRLLLFFQYVLLIALPKSNFCLDVSHRFVPSLNQSHFHAHLDAPMLLHVREKNHLAHLKDLIHYLFLHTHLEHNNHRIIRAVCIQIQPVSLVHILLHKPPKNRVIIPCASVITARNG